MRLGQLSLCSQLLLLSLGVPRMLTTNVENATQGQGFQITKCYPSVVVVVVCVGGGGGGGTE